MSYITITEDGLNLVIEPAENMPEGWHRASCLNCNKWSEAGQEDVVTEAAYEHECVPLPDPEVIHPDTLVLVYDMLGLDVNERVHTCCVEFDRDAVRVHRIWYGEGPLRQERKVIPVRRPEDNPLHVPALESVCRETHPKG